MKEFKVLPTDERFINLTDDQIGFILHNMGYDAKLEEQAMKGIKADSYYEDESDDWDVDINEFEIIKDGHDENDIANQVEKLTSKEDIKKARERYSTVEEWNEFLDSGVKLAEDVEKETYMQEQLKKVFAEAEELNSLGKVKETEGIKVEKHIEPININDTSDLKEAIDLFNGTEDSYNLPTSDDDEDFLI